MAEPLRFPPLVLGACETTQTNDTSHECRNCKPFEPIIFKGLHDSSTGSKLEIYASYYQRLALVAHSYKDRLPYGKNADDSSIAHASHCLTNIAGNKCFEMSEWHE